MTDLSLDRARGVLDAALAAAREAGVPLSVAVVDAGGHLKAFSSQDGATLGSIDIAVRKARTAQLFTMPTGTLGEHSRPGGALYGIELTNGGLVTFPGGVPLVDGATLLGAVGVSGGLPDDDQSVADAGAAAL
ncbi:GlcG/HbpS family heme-binding protein [Kineococcus terrestris]|uniref:GlcG/HbpS family heme-binding protein n=1 Tax=Kineococcus terrestris TaxID=2044856 RepID=UPI0034DB3F78